MYNVITGLLLVSSPTMSISQFIQEVLEEIEPNAIFTGPLPKVKSSNGKTYFVKMGSPSEAEQYIGEAESLKAMGAGAPGLVPAVYKCGMKDGRPYFISDYKEMGSGKAASVLAKRLATEMHRYANPNGKFGFEIPTYCGATRLQNGWFDTWEECYSSMMKDLVNQLKKRGKFTEVCNKADRVIQE